MTQIQRLFLLTLVMSTAHPTHAIGWKSIKSSIKRTPRWLKATTVLVCVAGIGRLIKNMRQAGHVIAPAGAPAVVPAGAPVLGGVPAPLVRRLPECDQAFFVNPPNRDRDTHLHVAARQNNGARVQQLLVQGARPYVRNLYSETPAGLARVQGHVPIQNIFAQGARDFEENRGWTRTVTNETVRGEGAGQHPNINSIIAEYVFGPNEQAWQLY